MHGGKRDFDFGPRRVGETGVACANLLRRIVAMLIPTGEIGADAVFICAAAPCVLFYEFIGRPIFGLAFAAAMLIALPVFRTTPAAASARLTCALAAITLTTLGGEGRLFAALPDWLVRDAVLHDLVTQPWPFVYRLDGIDWWLRAPLGMYLLPAAIGKLLGGKAAMLALWAQNSSAIYAVLRLLSASSRTVRSATVVMVFCLFSGWDLIGAFVLRGGMIRDIGWWAGLFQYSSTVTLAFWVPNHALAGWFVAALLLLWDQRRVGIAALMAGSAATMLWSPFALLGALPFLAKAIIEAIGERRIFRTESARLLPLTVGLLPVLAYLDSDSAGVPHGLQKLTPTFLIIYPLFITLELLPWIAVNALTETVPQGFARSTYLLALGVLLLIPFYHMGAGNDFVMRASIPALAVIAVTAGHTTFELFSARGFWRIAVVGIVVVIGAATGLMQARRVLTTPNAGVSRCDLIEAWGSNPTPKTHYLASITAVPPRLRPPRPHILVTGPPRAPCVDRRL